MSVERAFEIPSLVVNDRGGILSGDANPNTPGLAAPEGSLYMRSNGLHYRKTGALDNQWTETDTGGGGGGSGDLPFYNRAGAAEFIAIVLGQLPFFNRVGASENIGIV